MKKIFIAYFAVILLIVILVFLRFNKFPFTLGFLSNNNTTVVVNNKTFTVTLAKTPEDQQIGLSKTTKLDEDKGMLFVFKDKSAYPFWMKDMQIPIDIIYINDSKIVDLYENVQPPAKDTPTSNLQIIRPKEQANYVLEINAGLSKKYNIKIGDTVDLKNVK